MPKLQTITKQDGSLYGYEFECPGCEVWLVERDRALGRPADFPRMRGSHLVPTSGAGVTWASNHDVERPTFSPSILAHAIKTADGSTYKPRCHSFVGDSDGSKPGFIVYLADCEHPLAGQTVELPEIKEET